ERGLCYAQPQTAQAPRLEVPAGGLLLTGVALALKIRPDKSDLPGAQIAFIGQKIEKMFGKSDLRSLRPARRGELWNAT
ncbi:hypothetical protein ACTM8Z_06740, partial [Atopobiaceae bacterium HCP3S3_D6]